MDHFAFRQNNQSGFTLVEMAIVLMIIGLLVAGILRGKEMVDIAKLNSTIRQYQAYVGALHTFRNAQGGQSPGDMRVASQRIPGCQAGNTNSCINGNGDSRVGTEVMVWQGGQHPINTENTQFWKHLALSKVISGINPIANTPIWGSSHPIGPYGGYTVVTSQWAGESSVQTGALVLRLHMCLTCANTEMDGSGTNGSPIRPRQAEYIDSKIDDGRPRWGDVQAKAMGNAGSVAQCEGAMAAGDPWFNKYNPTDDREFCILNFLLSK